VSWHRTTSTSSAAAAARAQSAAPQPEAAAPQPQGSYKGRSVRIPLKPRAKPSMKTAKGSPKARKGSARRARSAACTEEAAAFDSELDSDDVDEAEGFHPGADLAKDSGADSGSRQGSDRGGAGDERSRKAPFRLGPVRPRTGDRAQRLLASGVPGADQVFGGPTGRAETPHEFTAGMATLMLGVVRAGAGDPSVIALAAQKAAVRRLGPGAPPTSLADVRSILLAACARPELSPPAPVPSERHAHQYALLPLVLLNPSRPRTQAMVDRASVVVDLLLVPRRP